MIFLLLLIASILNKAATSASASASDQCFFEGSCYESDAAQFYFDSLSSLPERELFVRMYILSNDDGSAQIVSESFTSMQVEIFNKYFKSTGVRFVHEDVIYRNSSMRSRYALPMCDFTLIGNGICDNLCNVSVTNFDGGDCLAKIPDGSECVPGVCNEACNIMQYKWDYGECCQEPYTSCRDPKSPYKVYYVPDYIKSVATPFYTDSWNIYILQYADCQWCGAASTFPSNFNASDPYAQGTMYNGMMLNKSFVYQMGVHEAGHTFGLLHPFSGSESGTINCSDPCFDGVYYTTNSIIYYIISYYIQYQYFFNNFTIPRLCDRFNTLCTYPGQKPREIL